MALKNSQWSRSASWGLMVLGVVLGFVVLARYASSSSVAKKADLKPSAVVSSPDGLTVRVTLGAQKLPVGTPVPLWLTVANEGDQPRRGMTLQTLQLDGMEAVGPCWEKVSGGVLHPMCVADAPTAAVHRWPLDIGAKKRVTFWASVAASASGTANFAAIFRVSAGDVGAGSSAPAVLRLLGPAVPTTHGWFGPDHLLILLGLLGDLALPVVLAGLGFFLKRASEMDTRRHEVWRQMLPRVHENAQKYYMPVSGAICAFRRRFDELVRIRESTEKIREEIKDLSDVERKDGEVRIAAYEAMAAGYHGRLFYHLIMVFVRMGALLRNIGGYYFQSEEGEWMAHHLWHVFREKRCCAGDFERYVDFGYVVDRLPLEESVASFSARLVAPSTTPNPSSSWPARLAADLAPLLHRQPESAADQQALHEALDRLRRWFDPWLEQELKQENDIYLLRVLEDVFDHEMNVPYRMWYGKSFEASELEQERLDNLKRCGPWLGELKKLAGDESAFQELYSCAKSYLGKEILPA